MDFFAVLFGFLPLLFLAFIFRWVRQIKINSETQIEQNKEIISLLQKIMNNRLCSPTATWIRFIT